MTTLLYNLDTQTPGEARSGRYIVDGKTGIFPSNYVELVVQDQSFPQYDPITQRIEYTSYYADIPNLLWTRNINVIDKTQEELAQEAAAEIARQRDQEYQNTINAGYNISGTQVFLGITDNDRLAWNQLLTLVNELISLGQIDGSTPLNIADKDGVLHTFPASQIKQILADLGMYYYTIWTQRSSAII